MNNNLTLADLQNKYRDQKGFSKKKADVDVEPEMKIKNIPPKENLSTVANPPNNNALKPKLERSQNLKQSPEVKPGKLKSKSEVKLRTLNRESKEVNDGPIMAFLLFSGLAMFVGIMLLVTNNSSGMSRANVLGQTTQQNTNRAIVDTNNNTVAAVQKSIDETNKNKQKDIESLAKEESQKSSETNAENNVAQASDTGENKDNSLRISDTEEIEKVDEIPNETAAIVLVRVRPNAQGGVNLRSEPNGATKASAVAGEEFELVSERDGWVEVKYSEDENYWVLADLVEKV